MSTAIKYHSTDAGLHEILDRASSKGWKAANDPLALAESA